MRNTRDAEQVLRIDGRGAFVEVTTSGLPIDKIYFGFVQYNKSAEKGSRTSGNIKIYMNILEAQVLARDIMSGRLAGLKMKELKRMQKAGEKYANPVYSKQGETPAASNNGQAIARLFEITPGSSQPWILCAKQGKAHETSEGLIVMEGKPETTIRVPCSDIALKQLALAIEAAVMTWVQLRFVPAAAPAMQVAAEKRKEAIDKAKADSAFRAMENAGRV